jgi:predicted O-methyltransferase YrrM
MVVNLDYWDGRKFRLADEWFDVLPLSKYENAPIIYLEIGLFTGANLFSVAETYGKHTDSKLYGVDPWEDYNEYPEYKNQILHVYDIFCKNLNNSLDKNKIIIKRGYSNKIIPTFEDNMFDIIYIDGNHETEYVLEDAILSFNKIKKGGVLIFDDYESPLIRVAIEQFQNKYVERISYLGICKDGKSQVFFRKNN